MERVSDSLRSMFDEPQSLTLSVLVFAVVFIIVAAAGLHLSKPPKVLDGKAFPSSRWRVSTSRQEASPKEAGPAGSPSDALGEFKKTMHSVYRVLAFLIVASLTGLTVASYFATNADDGSRLLTIILAAGTLILALHLHGIDRQHRPTTGDRALEAGPAHDVRHKLASRLGSALLGRASFEWKIASPEVYSIDQETLDRARAMATEGRPIDEICRAIAPEFHLWGPPHQQAYQAVVKAAIEHRD